MSLRTDADIAVQILHENGSFALTRDRDSQGFTPLEGVHVILPLEKFSANSILEFRLTNFKLLTDDPSLMIGGRLSNGVVTLELGKPGSDQGYPLIFAPDLVSDDNLNIDVGPDADLHNWQGILPGEAALPSGLAPTLAAMDDFAQIDETPVYKWVWSEDNGILLWQASEVDGSPIHADVIQQEWNRARTPKDALGFATVEDGGIQLESYGEHVPPKALQDVKQEFLKFFPGQQILLPEDHARPEAFSGPAPETLARRRTEAALWAQESFGDVTPDLMVVSKRIAVGRYTAIGLMLKEAASEADKDGCMVALYIPETIGKQITVKGGEPVEDLHITLAYFEDKAADRDDWDKAISIARKISVRLGELTGTLGGVGVFQNDDSDVLWASPNIPGLAEYRTELVEALNDGGFKVSETHGFQPHVTLMYDFKGKPPRVTGHDLHLDAAYFTIAEERHELPFG